MWLDTRESLRTNLTSLKLNFQHQLILFIGIFLIGGVSSQSTTPAGLSALQLDVIQTNLVNSISYSWEFGVAANAILELRYPAYSVFAENAPDLATTNVESIQDVYSLVLNVTAHHSEDDMPFANDSAVGDPLAIGNAIMLAAQMQGTNSSDLMEHVDKLFDSLWAAPKSDDGTISQREEYVQLWSDFIYMAPPFMALAGGMTNNVSLLQMAADQCLLYAQTMSTSNGVWSHIMMGPWQDIGAWSTGNGWSAYGQLKVLTIIHSSQFAGQLQESVYALVDTVKAILAGSWAARDDTNLLMPNYLYNNTNVNFPDTAGTALLTAATYRLAYLGWDSTWIPQAEETRMALLGHLDADGWMQNVVDPLQFDVPGYRSPEAQAFMLLMHAAWSDWANKNNIPVVNNPGTRKMRRVIELT